MTLLRSCRNLAAGGAGLLLAASWLAPAPAMAREFVHFAGYSAGTVVVKTSERRLYYVVGDGTAIRYPDAGQLARTESREPANRRRTARVRGPVQPVAPRSYG